ncbi:hypothetical protein EVAR_7728_1 [Eumeta japonica]|uniref:Uncharacterized protein n=1 Tax=Eumeta variegata TaxID=151549 RepID=A0A4C1TIV2_EUMVA|nr:hypothetical protein EVAR_7728_1 [Eumeta japonica]
MCKAKRAAQAEERNQSIAAETLRVYRRPPSGVIDRVPRRRCLTAVQVTESVHRCPFQGAKLFGYASTGARETNTWSENTGISLSTDGSTSHENDNSENASRIEQINLQCRAMSAFETRKNEKRFKRQKHVPKRCTINIARNMYECSGLRDSESESSSPHPKTIAIASEEKKRNKINKVCPLCKKDHCIKDCNGFRALSTEQRWERTKETHICFWCLLSAHRQSACRART